MSGSALHPPSSGEIEIDTWECDPVKTRRTSPYRPWQEIAADKKAEQMARIPREWLILDASLSRLTTPDLRPLAEASGILSTHELDITGGECDATALLAEIASGRLTAVEVVTAFCKRAAVAQQACNCLTELMFMDAIAAAKKLDEAYVETGKTVGPLHGLPMSFKVAKLWLRPPPSHKVRKECHILTSERNVSMSRATMPLMAIYPGHLIRLRRTLTSCLWSKLQVLLLL